MRLHRLTPFAAQQIRGPLRDAIAAAEPRDYLVSLGKSGYGWTCRILTSDLHLVGEAFHKPTMAAAFDEARAGMREKA